MAVFLTSFNITVLRLESVKYEYFLIVIHPVVFTVYTVGHKELLRVSVRYYHHHALFVTKI
jgi:hypothetical protein